MAVCRLIPPGDKDTNKEFWETAVLSGFKALPGISLGGALTLESPCGGSLRVNPATLLLSDSYSSQTHRLRKTPLFRSTEKATEYTEH